MRAALILKNESGVTPLLEYIITFVIASLIFSMMLLMSNSLFIETPQKIASKVQFTDIGNDLTAQIVDTYLIIPDKSTNSFARVQTQDVGVSTTFDIPRTVAGGNYNVSIKNSIKNMGNDKEIMVYSYSNDVTAEVTLNGVNSTIPITGSTSSGDTTHRIVYNP
jgi:hypothetical protein